MISIKLLCNFIEIAFRGGCCPLNLQYIFRTPFYRNIFEGLLLKVIELYSNCGFLKCFVMRSYLGDQFRLFHYFKWSIVAKSIPYKKHLYVCKGFSSPFVTFVCIHYAIISGIWLSFPCNNEWYFFYKNVKFNTANSIFRKKNTQILFKFTELLNMVCYLQKLSTLDSQRFYKKGNESLRSRDYFA